MPDTEPAVASPEQSPHGNEYWAFGYAVTAAAIGIPLGLVWWMLRSWELAGGELHRASWVVLVMGTLVVGMALVNLHAARTRVFLDFELESKKAESRLDPLTGLIGRAALTKELEDRLAHHENGELLGVLFCDLDRLGVLTHSLGHASGDEVVKVAARRLGRLVRDIDMLGSFGGDGFVVVSSGLPAVRDLEILADRVIESVRTPISMDDGVTQVVTASIGIAWTIRDGVQAEDLLRDAAAALSEAKSDGGGRAVLFDDAMRARALDRLEIERDLRTALERDELEVHYQPIVSLAMQDIDQFEALVRWSHPRRGNMRPAEFLPIAAESLLIVELGEKILLEACRRAVEWSGVAGRPLSIAVNVAERQLLDRSLVETVERVLNVTGLPANQLELEITEELIMESFDQSLVVLRQLDLLGVRLSIDDFGTSQASLSRLKKLAMVSTLKIDRLFIADIATDPVDRKIVAAIVALASSVGMSVVAEGVETEAQIMVLQQLGVDRVQGFLFGRPGKAPKVLKALEGARRPAPAIRHNVGEAQLAARLRSS